MPALSSPQNFFEGKGQMGSAKKNTNQVKGPKWRNLDINILIQESSLGHKWQIRDDVKPVLREKIDRKNGQSPLTPQIRTKKR